MPHDVLRVAVSARVGHIRKRLDSSVERTETAATVHFDRSLALNAVSIANGSAQCCRIGQRRFQFYYVNQRWRYDYHSTSPLLGPVDNLSFSFDIPDAPPPELIHRINHATVFYSNTNFLVILIITSLTGFTFLLTSLTLCYKNRKCRIDLRAFANHLYTIYGFFSQVVRTEYTKTRRKIGRIAKWPNVNGTMPQSTRLPISRMRRYPKRPKTFRHTQHSSCPKRAHWPSRIQDRPIRCCIRLCIMRGRCKRDVRRRHHQRYINTSINRHCIIILCVYLS